MGQVLHGSATTTAAVRRAIQHSQESLIALSQRYDINPKTVAKWRSRETVEDRKTGPSQPRSTILSKQEEAIIITFSRSSTLLPFPSATARIPDAIGAAETFITCCPDGFVIRVPPGATHLFVGHADGNFTDNCVPGNIGITPSYPRGASLVTVAMFGAIEIKDLIDRVEALVADGTLNSGYYDYKSGDLVRVEGKGERLFQIRNFRKGMRKRTRRTMTFAYLIPVCLKDGAISQPPGLGLRVGLSELKKISPLMLLAMEAGDEDDVEEQE